MIKIFMIKPKGMLILKRNETITDKRTPRVRAVNLCNGGKKTPPKTYRWPSIYKYNIDEYLCVVNQKMK